MNNKILVLMTITFIISAGLLVVTLAVDTDGSASAKKYKKTQTVAQVNNCGNYILPINVTCSNFNSNSKDNGDYDNVGATNPSLPPFP
jgi:hypothetical protein